MGTSIPAFHDARSQIVWFYEDERGHIEIVAGDTNPIDPAKIQLNMRTRKWYAYPAQLDQAVARIEALAMRHGNVYISVRLYDDRAPQQNTRSDPETKEPYTRPSRLIFIDDAPEEPYLFYSASIRTSEHSRHAYYKSDKPTTKDDARRAARFLSGDPSGVDLTQLVRVVGTYNTKHNKRFPVELEDSGPIYDLDTLRDKLPPVEPEKGKGTIEALDWPEVEAHLSNIDALLTCARSQLIKPDTQTGRILGGEMLAFPVKGKSDDSRSMNASAVATGFYLRGYTDDEIAAVVFHLYQQWGVERDKGTAWCKVDIGRILAYAHANNPNVKQSPTRYRQAQATQTIAEIKPRSRARLDRPQRFTASALYLTYQARPDLCDLKRKGRAAALSISTATLDRLEDALEKEGLIEVETDPRRQGSRVILRGVINIAPAEVLSAPPAATVGKQASSRAESGQTVIESPQCIGETPPPPETPRPAAPPLDTLVRAALAALPRERVSKKTGELKRWPITAQRVLEWLDRLAPFYRVDRAYWQRAVPIKLAQIRREQRNAAFAKVRDLSSAALDKALRAASAEIAKLERIAANTNPIDPEVCQRFGCWDAKAGKPTRPAWSSDAEGEAVRAAWAKEASKRRGRLAMLATERAARDAREERLQEQNGYCLAEQRAMLDRIDQEHEQRELQNLRKPMPYRTGRAARPIGAECPPQPTPIDPMGIVGRLYALRDQRAAQAAIGGD